jgi:predicted nucleotidyltransferase
MIVSSQVSSEAAAYIRQCLDALAEAEGVRILFAIESGSRAWGFPSADSDYDVRFVYVRPKADYLSIQEFRDVIETPTADDPVLGVPLDLNGWDLCKALRLALTSNPVLHEWLSSPIAYSRDPKASQAITDIAVQAADRDVFRYHYDRLCRSAWNQMQAPRGATIKRYCYALRPALMLRWLGCRADLPPMDVHHLCAGLAIAGDTLHDMAELIRAKALGGEKDGAANVRALDAMIAAQLAIVAPRPEKMDIVASPLKGMADALFRQMIDG